MFLFLNGNVCPEAKPTKALRLEFQSPVKMPLRQGVPKGLFPFALISYV
jgi:hypothetical protein